MIGGIAASVAYAFWPRESERTPRPKDGPPVRPKTPCLDEEGFTIRRREGESCQDAIRRTAAGRALEWYQGIGRVWLSHAFPRTRYGQSTTPDELNQLFMIDDWSDYATRLKALRDRVRSVMIRQFDRLPDLGTVRTVYGPRAEDWLPVFFDGREISNWKRGFPP